MTSAVTAPPSSAVQFFHRLRHRLGRDPGFAAHLRRAAGEPLARYPHLVEWYGFLERVPEDLRGARAAEPVFLAATLYSLDRRDYRRVAAGSEDGPDDPPTGDGGAGERSVGNLGASLGALVQGAAPEQHALARRLAVLIDSTLDGDGGGTLPWRLRRVITLALSRKARIDWPRLLHDLLRWNHPRRVVQREWARAYYRLATTPDADPGIAAATDPSLPTT